MFSYVKINYNMLFMLTCKVSFWLIVVMSYEVGLTINRAIN